MYSLKGFVEFADFANNTPGEVAVIGELSTLSSTYAKDKGYYDSLAQKDIELTTFFSKLDNVVVAVPGNVKNAIFDIVGWLYGQMVSTTNTEDRTNILTMIGNTYGSVVEEIEAGVIVDDGTNFIPEWISFKIIGQEKYIRLWFSDASFQTQYDEFEIVVVPPMVSLDNFFLQATEVEARMVAMTTTKMVDNLQAAKVGYPETIIRVETYDYVAPGNATYRIPTRWGVLIYGNAGNNVDSIKDALVNYILTHSGRPRSDWVELIPDLFKRTEFIFTPLWNQYGIPNRTLEAGIYSPLAKYADALLIAKQSAPEYPVAHVEAHLSFCPHTFKSLIMTIVGGPENREGKFYFTDFYSDYINVNTSSVDFNRMSPATQELATILAEMVYYAESVDKYTVLPFGLTKLVRSEILYVVKTIDNVQLLVAAKVNFATTTNNPDTGNGGGTGGGTGGDPGGGGYPYGGMGG